MTTTELRRIPLSKIIPSSTNPRTFPPGADIVKLWALQELADDIKACGGVHTPITVRPAEHVDELYEVVAGERRWRASPMAGEVDIPAFVKPLTDAEARRLQWSENEAQRPLNPLERARGYHMLLAADGVEGFATVEELAADIGTSAAHVRQYLKLLQLCPEAQTAIWEARLGAGQALAVASIPNARLQAKATAEILAGFGGEPFSAKAAREHVRKHYRLQLDKAPFPITQVDWPGITPAPGRCTQCDKRTGAEPGLFEGEHIAGDWCRDAACWERKQQAHHEAERKHALAQAGKAAEQPPPKAKGAAARKNEEQAPPPAAQSGAAEPSGAAPAPSPSAGKPTEAEAEKLTAQRAHETLARRFFRLVHTELALREIDTEPVAYALRITARSLFGQLSHEAAALLYRVRDLPEPKLLTWTDDFAQRIDTAPLAELVQWIAEIPIAETVSDALPPDQLADTDANGLAFQLGMTMTTWDKMVRESIEHARIEVAEQLGLGPQAMAKQKRGAKAQARADATAAFLAHHQGSAA